MVSFPLKPWLQDALVTELRMLQRRHPQSRPRNLRSACSFRKTESPKNSVMQNKAVSVVIPVYNSAAILPHLLARLHPVLVSLNVPFEIILINDGSKDNSWDVVLQLTRQGACVHAGDLMRNFGQHNALLCGIRQARFS